MNKYIAGILLTGACVGLSSCNDFLDMTPTDQVVDKIIWVNLSTAEQAVNSINKNIINGMLSCQCEVGLTDALTDQLKYGNYNYNALNFIPSEIAYGGSNLTSGYVDAYMGYWGSYMSMIRETNQGLNYLHNYGSLPENDTKRLEAEMRLVRGYLYFEMLKRYKEVIIYDEDLSKITKDKAVSTEEEGWDFVYEDLKFAGETLPAREKANGRANCGQAWAIMSRAMLYANRWEEAKKAAEEVEKLGYELEGNYADAYGKSISAGNKEAIVQALHDREPSINITHDFDFYYTPGGDFKLIGQSQGGYATPTQEMVESYEYADGGFPDWTKWHADGVTETPPYDKLEPRFHASILYNGADWKGRQIESYVGGLDGFCQWRVEAAHDGRSTTGYFLRKNVDENHNLATQNGSVQPLTPLRFAEVLLNKAEACYRLGDNAGANKAVRMVRERVGLPYNDKAGENLWNAIRQERKVELAFEGLWYWDLRRWDAAKETYPTGLNGYQVHGLRIEKTADGFVYNYVSVDDKDRNYPAKMNRFPMPESELNNNSMVTQYPEWR